MGGGRRGEECRWGEGEGERNVGGGRGKGRGMYIYTASYNYIAELPWKLSTFQVCMELCEFCILVSSVCVDGSLNKTTHQTYQSAHLPSSVSWWLSW